MKLYKHKYLIGIYKPECEGETLLGLCDNISEFAEFLSISKDNAQAMLSRLFKGTIRYLRFCGKWCKVEFIDITEEFKDV